MKTTKFFILAVLVTSLFVSSCSKEIVSVPVPIPDFTVNLSTKIQDPQSVSVLRSSDEFKSFSGEGTLNMNDDEFTNLKYKYQTEISLHYKWCL